MKPMPYIGLFLIIAYAVVLLPYYFNGSLINFLFYSINNAAHMGIILCGVKIIQDVTEYEDEIIFRKLSIIGIIGLLSCNFGYFLENNNHFQLFHFIFLTSCLISMIKCFFILRKAVKEKGLEKNFIVAIIILTFISIFEVFPITNGNILLVFKLRLIASIFLPFAISTFPALVFVKSMHNYDLKQAEVESLTLEKQAILETQNETLAIQVAEQTSELKALNSTKDRLFSIIGHDLRSPIASLKGVLLLLDNQQLSREEFNDLLLHLQKNVDNVHGMLENLLQWSLSQMKGMKPNLKVFEMNDVIEQTIELFKEVAKQKNIELRTNILENLTVFADENHVQAVIRNLLNNALKFTPKDGNVSVSGKFKNNFVELQIINSGIGISTDELQTIFSNPKLKQGTAGEKGTGLGLILCKDLIKQNSGEISVKSDFMKNTTFEVLIPKKAEFVKIQPD